ncbi:MAG: GGDEF domain-containing protein [Alphaproteobacteria bacterium]|nr:GGDEF domain-containing protein [Alphaproteobacteria bacterium]
MSEQQATSPFSFDREPLEQSTGQPASALLTGDDLMRSATEASGLAAYHWNIESDEIAWSPNAQEIFDGDLRGFSTGRAFASFLDPDNFTSRYDTVMRSNTTDDGSGVPFQIEYKFRPEGRMGRASLWIEDQGRWFGGPDGRPTDVYGTVRRIDDRHMRDQHLSFLGNCDPLTGMMNRGRMMEALSGAMTVASRDGTACAFVIAAINNLSVVNDSYGFEVADEVIINMGRRLRQVVRTGDAIARYSGSKFGLILNNCSEDDLTIAAERFLSVARESVIETERGPVWALLSIGALILPKHAADANTAVARAEEALTESRKLPSDGFVIFKPSQQRTSERTLNAHSATEIVRCLREDRFRLAFQPVVDATTGEPVFHEALLRMTDSAGEIVAAGHLIPIAEKLGLVRLIDRAVVQMAVAALHRFPDAKLSFNLSGTTATDPRWYPHIVEILASNKDVTKRLIVEITETVALGDLRETIRFVDQLRALGCQVAIDDFGAGYTSFRNLRAMPVDVLKLDGTFCSDLAGNSDNQYFVRSLIDLARTFGMKTVAEWVETEEDAALLREWKVDLMQGNLFGEAQLEPPWTSTDPIHASSGEDAMPFMLPSELSWPDDDEEMADAEPADITLRDAAPGAAETGPLPAAEENLFDFDAPLADEYEIDQAQDVEALPPVGEALPPPAEPEPMMQAEAASDTAVQATPEHEDVVDVQPAPQAAADPDPKAETAAETVEHFEEGLAGELDKLRAAIAALDQAFKRKAPQPDAEPSFADLVSDTAMRAAS